MEKLKGQIQHRLNYLKDLFDQEEQELYIKNKKCKLTEFENQRYLLEHKM